MVFSRKLAQATVLAVALSVAAVLVIGVMRGRHQSVTQENPAPDPAEAEMRLSDMEYTEMQEGRRLWTLKASEAKYFQEEQKSLLTSVRMTFFLENGEEIQLESQEGVLHAGTKNIELWNSVRATLPQGYELSTERVHYNHQEKRIFSETALRLIGPDAQLQGKRWEYRIPEHQAVLEGGVEASMSLLPPKTETSQ